MKTKWCIVCRRDKKRLEDGWLSTKFGALCPTCRVDVEDGFSNFGHEPSLYNVQQEIRCCAHADALMQIYGKDAGMTDAEIVEAAHGRSKSELFKLYQDACRFEEEEMKQKA